MDGSGWQVPTGPHLQGDSVSEVSTADLNHQANQERLSFIHSQESSEEPDYDQVPLPSLSGEETVKRRGKREVMGIVGFTCVVVLRYSWRGLHLFSNGTHLDRDRSLSQSS